MAELLRNTDSAQLSFARCRRHWVSFAILAHRKLSKVTMAPETAAQADNAWFQIILASQLGGFFNPRWDHCLLEIRRYDLATECLLFF